jgi:Rps23 Pro-64 3,4-dihydroxylase Tpa1-like proline 4-hydroxylase
MIDIKKFREQGYLYDSLEKYKDIIDLNAFDKIKEEIDSINIKQHSRYDYWFIYKDLSYKEELVYDELLRNDKDLNTADIVYQKSHEYQLKKIEECGFYPTWVFGTALDERINHLLRNGVISDFQRKFIELYYPDKVHTGYCENLKLQFYDKGCLIEMHDDGKQENRICVFLYFLNNEWNDSNGGHLILHTLDGQKLKIKPTFPNFAVLDSDINLFHEVEKVLNNIKYNIVCFFEKK